jgi:hypothetical protein
LLKQHLERIDAEIAAAEKAEPTRVMLPDGDRLSTSSATAEVGVVHPDALLEKYRAEARSSPAKVKLGCWAAFLAASGAFWALVGLWYFLKTR